MYCSRLSSQPVAFDYYSLAEGLPQSSVNTMLQDTYGFLWFGTQDGLCRFDGYSFRIFRHNPNDSASLTNNYVNILYQDKAGILWVGTNNGLNVYNPKTDKFTRLYHTEQPGSLHNDNISCLLEDRHGNFWVGSQEQGVCILDRKTMLVRQVFRHHPQDAASLPSNVIRQMYEDRAGNIWFATNKGLAHFQEDTNNFTILTQFGAKKRRYSSESISTIYEDRSGHLWIGTRNGVHRYNLRTGIEQSYFINNTTTSIIPESDVNCILEDRQGLLWIGFHGGGLGVLNPHNGTITRYYHNPAQHGSLSNNFVVRLLEDRQGTLWIGTFGGGISLYDRDKTNFTLYRMAEKPGTGLSDKSVYGMVEDRRGNLWVGTDNGLNMLNKTTGKFEYYRHIPGKTNGLPHDVVNSVCEDSAGNIWVATFGGGIARFAPSRKQWAIYRNDPNKPRSLSHNTCVYVFTDKKGNVWVCTSGGLNRFNPTSKDWDTFRHTESCTNCLINNYTVCLAEDAKGLLWIGTEGSGLQSFDPQSGKFTTYQHIPNNKNSLSSNSVNVIYADTDGMIWVGTQAGLNRLNPYNGEWKIIRESHGLPNDVIYGILPDKRGNLWLSTNNGIARYHPTTGKIMNFGVGDGLQSNEYNQTSYHAGKSGRLYFGGIEGLNEFLPETITDNIHKPDIVFTDFKKFNKSVQLDTAIISKHVVELDYTENFITIEFAALNFRAPEKNRYMYKLEGFDKNWIDAGTKREATYTNLDGKTYIFRVKAANNDGIWNETGISLKLIVHPPWWRTWWFRFFAIMTVVAGGLVWYRLRVYRIHQHNEQLAQQVLERTIEIQQQNNQLKTLNQEKNELMGIVAHDLKNPLSNIRLLAQLLRQNHETLNQAEIKELSGDILFSADRMYDLIINLLNVNAIEQGGVQFNLTGFEVCPIIESIIHHYTPLARQKNIRLCFTPPEHNGSGFVVFADHHAIAQILDNLLSNAIKYSPLDKEIHISIAKSMAHHGTIRVGVHDQGPGISDEDQQLLFGKFARLSARPTGGEDSTGLGLSIVKKLAEAMNGKVWCESALGSGATFYIEFPAAFSELNP